MMRILEGQDYLYDLFDEMSYSELPHSILLNGESGCGKHTFSQYIADKFNLNLFNITKDISADLLDELSLRSVASLYVVDIDLLNDKQQSKLLKFLEDYNDFTYVCVISSNLSNVLKTIRNRCISYKFNNINYELKKKYAVKYFNQADIEVICKFCDTVGQMIRLQSQDFTKIKDLSENIINNIARANISNALSIANKFNYGDTYDQIDVELFFRIMLDTISSYFIQNKIDLDYYTLTLNYLVKLEDKRLNRKDLIESFLLDFWRMMRGV